MATTIDFQFLRDCITALKVVNTGQFTMLSLFRAPPVGRDLDRHCGTPACVIGHYVAYKKGEYANYREQILAGHQHLGLNSQYHPGLTQAEVEALVIHGLTHAQREELFGEEGCGYAATKEEAIAYLEKFIVEHGGRLTDPQPPNWQAIAQAKEATCPLT